MDKIDKAFQKRMDEVLAQADREASLSDTNILEMVIKYLSDNPSKTLDEISEYLGINGNRVARIVARNSRTNEDPIKWEYRKIGGNTLVTVYLKNQ